MLTHIDTLPLHNMFDDERSNMIKAIEDIFRTRHQAPQPNLKPLADSTSKKRSITRLPVAMLQQSENRMHYELLSIVPIRDSLAIVKILQTPLDKDGRRIEEATSSPLMVIAKSDGEWELVGLPLPRHCLLY
ncbi:hypothetical protein [Cellvibrio sp. PSBB006]|uniref:hypothetical protein n=1 Tax=Cellvibrio sp. PSBB006 TaxID=1987723 RepID=UPI000B3B9376|nr:hypothetical protein [Cellvibrio sp. PSBB006]ARU27228.1 hypothetical protein CBR65_07140 [Cellvibrio sp. PSBB006]